MTFNQDDLRRVEEAIVNVHAELRDECLRQCGHQSMSHLASVAKTGGAGDVTFQLDLDVEALLPQLLGKHLAPEDSMLVLFEGQTEPLVIPAGLPASQARWISLWDPVDGSRVLAFQLRSAWVLTLVCANRVPPPTLQDGLIAVQSEIPLLNQREAAVVRVIRNGGISVEMIDMVTGTRRDTKPEPSTAGSIENGLVGTECYFDGPTDLLAELEERIILRTLGPGKPGAARVWRDCYISSAGTFFLLAIKGSLRWAHDWRPIVRPIMERRGQAMSLTAHNYDCCTFVLIAEATGVILTGRNGKPLDAPLSDLERDITWTAYSNGAIRDQMQQSTLDETLRFLQDKMGGIL